MERGSTVPDLLEAAARDHPRAAAVVAGDGCLTYAELDEQAGRLARSLCDRGVAPEDRVGVCLPRSTGLAVALWGVLKAGAACVPIDPAYPAERRRTIAEDAGVAVLFTPEAPALHAAVPCAAGPPPRPHDPDHLAYVVYTSGSTGRPKGVMLTHRGLVNHHRAAIDLYGLAPGDRVLQFCSLGFDASIEEMYPTWIAGGTVVFRPEDRPLLGADWLAWLADAEVSVLNLPTAYWHAWARDLDSRDATLPEAVRLVVVGGEKANGKLYRAWARRTGGRARWVNVYGPTETTCMSTYYEPGDVAIDGDPPIGRPLPNTTLRVVDDQLRSVPAGATGELLIGGAGVARGYLHQPALTAERFVDVGERMYRTGDLVRMLPSGDLTFVGRVDGQVKLNGFRIEPGEIEAALAAHPGVAGALVAVRSDPASGRRLVAYVVPDPALAPTGDDLRRHLGERLPAHAVPAAYVTLDAFPLTPNGKVDRQALPAPPRAGDRAPGDRAPAGHLPGGLSTPVESRVAAVWGRVLGIDPVAIGPTDDFFALGGHSLLATQVIAQLREDLGTQTPLRAIFEAPTVAGLAAIFSRDATRLPDQTLPGADVPAGPAAPAIDRGARVPLGLAQEQMWELEAAASPPGLFNITAIIPLEGAADPQRVQSALDRLVERHEMLRASFAVDEGGPYQTVHDRARIELAVADVEDDGALGDLIAAQDALAFDVAHPPLARAGLFRFGNGSPARLAVTFDHLVVDGNGVMAAMRDLRRIHEAEHGRGTALPFPSPPSFVAFAAWQRAHVSKAILDRQLEWWTAALAGAPRGPAVPFETMPDTPTRRIGTRSVAVPSDLRDRMEALARDTQSTVFVVAASAVATLFGRAGDRSDVVLTTTLNGRNRAELEDVVGIFSGIGRIRTDLSGDPPFATVVARTRDHVLGMFDNQDVPFMHVRGALYPDFPTTPLGIAAILPIELQYFRTGPDEPELFFRGQLHPLSVTLYDDGSQIDVHFSYKLDFYRAATIDRLAQGLLRMLDAAARQPTLRVSELPTGEAAAPPLAGRA